MGEEETNFDPSLKKKKKKKKTPFDLDGALNEGGEDMEASKDDDAVADDIDLDSFGTKKKKKKKGKKKPLGMEELEDALPNDDENEDLDLESFGKKKKKRKMRMSQPGVDLIEIILTMNCYNAFTLL